MTIKQMITSVFKYILTLLLLLLVFPGVLLCAEDSEERTAENVLEEIVVSGYRLTSRLELDTSLNVFDRETIELSTAEHFEELVQMVPNMNLSGEGSRARYFQLRGVGELEQYEGAPNPSVAYIIDDIDLSGIGGVASLYDIGQIEKSVGLERGIHKSPEVDAVLGVA